MPAEQKWHALTGRVVDAKVEADSDIHIALMDANGNGVGTVSAEIPVGPKWCEIRQTVSGWTTQKFPFSVKTTPGSKFTSCMSSRSREKLFMTLATRQRIIQTDKDRGRTTWYGKFIR
jgi:hypothetical protein